MHGVKGMATYTPGEPNETIFVRNIHRRATLEELQAIFGVVFPSDTAAAQYGWLVGCFLICDSHHRCVVACCCRGLVISKRRGQAHVTFPNSAMARTALQRIHGYKLRNLPLVIVRGTQQTGV